MYNYIIWLLIFVWIPAIFLYYIQREKIKKYRKVTINVILGSYIFGIPWDILATKLGIWYFRKPYVIGINFLGLPIEEYLFITSVPILISFTTIYFYKK